jgi:glycerol-3-phosphate dehydrogenase (NAD(P)+)
VVGAGSWGTALANVLAKKDIDTTIWAYEAEVAQGIRAERRNPVYLSEIELDPRLRATTSVAEAVTGADVVVSVSPSHVVRGVMAAARPHLAEGVLLVSASKGIEVETLKTMDQVLEEVIPRDGGTRMAFLSGPSFALEVAREHPTAVTMASRDPAAAESAQEVFQTDYFRVYTSKDVTGVEVGGSLKNVIAIASGVVAGLGFGHNTLAALITRGLAEMTRLGVHLGADPRTFAGLAGMGDLILTCTGSLSRNRSVGMELGEGRRVSDVLAGMRMVAEGVQTTRSARDLARRTGVEMPIVEEVYSILFEEKPPRTAVENLMLRTPKAEWW